MKISFPREKKNISRAKRSFLRGFCHYPHSGFVAGQRGCDTSKYKSSDSSFPPILSVMYCVRVSLRTVKIFLAQHYL
jgi:hypothetical protein